MFAARRSCNEGDQIWLWTPFCSRRRAWVGFSSKHRRSPTVLSCAPGMVFPGFAPVPCRARFSALGHDAREAPASSSPHRALTSAQAQPPCARDFLPSPSLQPLGLKAVASRACPANHEAGQASGGSAAAAGDGNNPGWRSAAGGESAGRGVGSGLDPVHYASAGNTQLYIRVKCKQPLPCTFILTR